MPNRDQTADTLSLAVVYLDALLFISGCIWIGILGRWSTLGTGIAIGIVSAWIIPLLLTPSTILERRALAELNSGRDATAVRWTRASIFWMFVVMSAFCLATFRLLTNGVTGIAQVPSTIVAYTISTWTFMRPLVQGKDLTDFVVAISMKGAFVLLAVIALGCTGSFQAAVVIFAVCMVLLAGIQMFRAPALLLGSP